MNRVKIFIVGSTFYIVFGMIDNLGLFVGMEGVEDFIINLGLSHKVAAGLGNTFSDAIGALSGGIVAGVMYKIFKVKGSGTIREKTVGVVIGCLIPVIFLILYEYFFI